MSEHNSTPDQSPTSDSAPAGSNPTAPTQAYPAETVVPTTTSEEKPAKRRGRTALIAGGAALGAILLVGGGAAIGAAVADGDDDDDLKRFLLTETGSAMVGGIPVVRDVYSAVAGYGGGGIYGSLADAPSNFLKQAAQGENDKALRRSIADIVGMMTGLPTTGPMRAIEGALDENVPLSEAIFGRNPLGR